MEAHCGLPGASRHLVDRNSKAHAWHAVPTSGENGIIGSRALDAQSVSSIVKGRANEIGLNGPAYSGHSLRAGFVTPAARAGFTAPTMMRQTGHRLVEMVRYIRNASLFDDNAAAHLL